MLIDPIASGELGEPRLITPARRYHIDVLNGGRFPEDCELQPDAEPLVDAAYSFAAGQSVKPLFEVERGNVRHAPLIVERRSHTGETKIDQ